MINVSDQLLKESKENQDYYVTANVTLADGTNLPLKKEDFYLDGNGIVDSADSSSFPIGVAIEKTATMSCSHCMHLSSWDMQLTGSLDREK